MITIPQFIFGALFVVVLFWFLIHHTDKGITRESRKLQRTSEAMRIMDCIHILRALEGDEVVIPAENREADEQNMVSIHCSGDWTNFSIRVFTGPDLITCLELAVLQRQPYDQRRTKDGFTAE